MGTVGLHAVYRRRGAFLHLNDARRCQRRDRHGATRRRTIVVIDDSHDRTIGNRHQLPPPGALNPSDFHNGRQMAASRIDIDQLEKIIEADLIARMRSQHKLRAIGLSGCCVRYAVLSPNFGACKFARWSIQHSSAQGIRVINCHDS